MVSESFRIFFGTPYFLRKSRLHLSYEIMLTLTKKRISSHKTFVVNDSVYVRLHYVNIR